MARKAQPYREVRLENLDGGLNDHDNPTKLKSDESPSAVNVDFDRSSVTTSMGAIKFNNQVAPRSGVRTRVDPALSPLGVASGPLAGTGTSAVEVPLRGYAYFPYQRDYDIGGQFQQEGTFPTIAYHPRRGRSFELNVSFRIPQEEKLYEAETRGANAPAVGAESVGFNPPHGFDEALDECFCILQKGGDRTTPMSWALAIVNVGKGVGLTSLPQQRVSNYALCWIWFDAPQFGVTDTKDSGVGQSGMEYNLTSGQNPVTGGNSKNCTQAFRAVLIHKYLEPGRDYSVAVQLSIDSGSAGSSAANTSWNHDGFFKVYVSEDRGSATSYTFVDSSGSGTATNVEVIRGPTDSLQYLCKYGIRYSGRDAMFAGLGMRSISWMTGGFIPYGHDACSLKNGGYQMVDRSAVTVASLFGGGVYTLTCQHTSGDAFVTIENGAGTPALGLTQNNTNGGTAPFAGNLTGVGYTKWQGFGNTNFAGGFGNSEALRGYRLVVTNDFTAGAMDGGIMQILTYSEGGGNARLDITNGATAANFTTWAATPCLISCFRWHQRDLEISEVRIWAAPRDYDSANAIEGPRRLIGLRQSLDIKNGTEPDLGTLLAYWPMSDAEGTTLEEALVGGLRNAYLTPFGLGKSEGGVEGSDLVFVSGEGEAVRLDFSKNPIFQREMQRMLSSKSQGFAIELSCVFTEAFYAIPQLLAVPDHASLIGVRPRFVPDLLTFDVKNASATGMRSTPRTLLSLTHRGMQAASGNGAADITPWQYPCGLGVEVAHRSDNESVDPVQPQDLQPWYLNNANAAVNRYDLTGTWVGRPITIQVGIQSTGTTDQYDVYVAMTPKDALNPASGDPSNAEFAYWTAGGQTYSSGATLQAYFSAAHLTIARKDLVRSVVTIGRWNPAALNASTPAQGYCEMQPRLLVDKVRFYASSAPGALPATNGGIVTNRDGKLGGEKSLPSGELSDADMLQPLGPGVLTVNVSDGSVTVTPAVSGRFFTAEARTTSQSIKHSYLYVPGDTHTVLSDQAFSDVTQEEFYRVEDTPTTFGSAGGTLTLASPFADATRSAASAFGLRLFGYSTFDDDIRDAGLTLGAGTAFTPGTTTTADVIEAQGLWRNKAKVTADIGLRIYSPLGRVSLRDILPRWTRGHVTPIANPILGIASHAESKYALVQGAVYELDDRWREDGPTDTLRYSLHLRSASVSGDVTAGLQADRVEFSSAAKAGWAADNTYMTVIDAWVKLDSVELYQTVLWIGVPTDNPALSVGSAGSTSENRMQMAVRFFRGRPELVIGTLNNTYYTGTTRPEKGLFIATGVGSIQPGVWTHIRWYLVTYTNGATQVVLKQPNLKVQGRKMTCTVNAVDNGITGPTSTDWIRTAQIVPLTSCKVIVGATHDGYRQPQTNIAFSAVALGTNVQPQFVQGYLHSLGGLLSETTITRQPPFSSSEPADFDPFNVSYNQASFNQRFHILAAPEGIGHKVDDEPGSQNGTIVSHPFISVWHELGALDQPASFAEFGQQLYATTGGLVVRMQDGEGGFAGVFTPTTAPDFRIERLPIWTTNFRDGFVNAENDPIADASATAALRLNHFDAHGNTYLKQTNSGTGLTESQFVNDGTDYRYFGFKGYLRLRDTSGRQVIWARRSNSQQGGPFLECIDGRLRFGWYDQFLKKDVYVETSDEVVKPGQWTYVNIRKRWPQHDALDGNWQNSYFTNGTIRRVAFNAAVGTFQVGEAISWTAGGGAVGTGRVTRVFGAAALTLEYVATGGGLGGATSVYTGGTSGATGTATTAAHIPIRPMYDLFVVGQFQKEAATNTTLSSFQIQLADRTCISLTTSTLTAPTGTTATGFASIPGCTYTGAAGGNITAAAGYAPFHDDMVGMLWQFGGSTTVSGISYRITAIGGGGTTAQVVDEQGNAPNLAAAVAGTGGGVFFGVALVKSTDFDNSKMPDNGAYPITMMGSSDQGAPLSGVAPFNGEMDSVGWTFVKSRTGTNAGVFETSTDYSVAGAAANDPIECGTDRFLAQIYDVYDLAAAANVQPGELMFDAWVPATFQGSFTFLNGRAYAAATQGPTSQPNTNLEVALDTGSSVNAAVPLWQYVQPVSTLSGSRFVRCVFYDLDQNELSDPGPELEIKPDAEDAQNPSGQVRYVVTNLPFPRQEGRFEVWVYMSLAAGDSTNLFLVARVPAGTREVAVQAPDATIALGEPISFTNGAPPRCSLITAARSRLFYAALEAQPDGLVYSQPGFPVSIDYALPVTRYNSGFGDEITMLEELDGFVVVGKRRGLGSITIGSTGLATVDHISSGVGCVSSQSAISIDGRLYFLGEEGLYLTTRAGITNLSKPVYLGEKLRQFFYDELDRRFTWRASAAVFRKQKQYVCTARLVGRKHQDAWFAALYSHDMGGDQVQTYTPSGHTFSRYEGLNLTAFASVQNGVGSPEELVAGTEEGFVLWMGRDDTNLLGMGRNGVQYGYPKLVTTTGSTTNGIVTALAGNVDLTLEGPRGLPVRYVDQFGAIQSTVCLGVYSTSLLFRDATTEVCPTDTIATVAERVAVYETPWLDMGNPERRKQLNYLNVITRRHQDELEGSLRVEVLHDLNDDEVLQDVTLDIREVEKEVPLGDIEGQWFKFRFSTPVEAPGDAFQIASLVVRITDQDQT